MLFIGKNQLEDQNRSPNTDDITANVESLKSQLADKHIA